MKAWIANIQAHPELRLVYNARRDFNYRRILLQPNPQSKAYNDLYYRAAFINQLVKAWSEEPEILIIRNYSTIIVENVNEFVEIQTILNTYQRLKNVWKLYENTCTIENCKLCLALIVEEQAETEKDDDDENDEEKDEGAPKKDQSNLSNDNHQDPSSSKIQSSSKAKDKQNPSSSNPPQSSRNALFLTRPVKHLLRGRKTILKSKWRKFIEREEEPDWKPYTTDNSKRPYSHRYGYSYADITSSKMMKMW